MPLHSERLLYLAEHRKYGKYTNQLFWYKKHKGKDWSKGQNFGDYLSKVLVGEIVLRQRLKTVLSSQHQLLAIGSILHFARDGDTVWGSGINGKIALSKLAFKTLDVRSVRGPLTQKILLSRGIQSADVFGDPAILLPYLFPDLTYKPIPNKVILLPNLNEYEACKTLKTVVSSHMRLVSPLLHWRSVMDEVLTSEVVLTSSLHGLILSETFRVPVYLFRPFGGETMHKYEDYLEGSGRKLHKIPKSFLEGTSIKNGVNFAKPCFDEEKLLQAFPFNFYTKELTPRHQRNTNGLQG